MALLFVPSALVMLAGLLLLASWLEQNVVSPRALIATAARAKTDPDIAERVVAIEAERLLAPATVAGPFTGEPASGQEIGPETG